MLGSKMFQKFFLFSLFLVKFTANIIHHEYRVSSTLDGHTLKPVGWIWYSAGSYQLHEKKRLAVCPASSLELIGKCKWMIHAWCCHRLATNAAFSTKVVAWPLSQASWDKHHMTLVTLQREYQSNYNETEPEWHLMLHNFTYSTE